MGSYGPARPAASNDTAHIEIAASNGSDPGCARSPASDRGPRRPRHHRGRRGVNRSRRRLSWCHAALRSHECRALPQSGSHRSRLHAVESRADERGARRLDLRPLVTLISMSRAVRPSAIENGESRAARDGSRMSSADVRYEGGHDWTARCTFGTLGLLHAPDDEACGVPQTVPVGSRPSTTKMALRRDSQRRALHAVA